MGSFAECVRPENITNSARYCECCAVNCECMRSVDDDVELCTECAQWCAQPERLTHSEWIKYGEAWRREIGELE
jgi:hypothetical protein